MDTRATNRGDLTPAYLEALNYSNHQPRQKPAPGLVQLISQETKNNDHIYIGESHYDGSTIKMYELFANDPNILRGAAQNNVKHLVLEIPRERQDLIDSYYKGEISEEDVNIGFRDFEANHVSAERQGAFRQALVQTIKNAKESGISVHCNDHLSARAAELADSKADPQAYREFDANRFDDRGGYEYMRSRIPVGEKTIGLVGIRHLNNSANENLGIDDLLRADGQSVSVIEFETDVSKELLGHVYEYRGVSPKQTPNYTVNLDHGTIKDAKGENVGNIDAPMTEPPKVEQPVPLAL